MRLQAALQSIDQPSQTLSFADGSRLLLLPAGARVLGLFGPDDDDNFFWANPDLEDRDKALALFGAEGWRNTGGDRTWLTPEIDFFFPGFPHDQTHVEPPELDAADYDIQNAAGEVGMVRRMTLPHTRTGRPIELELGKWLSPTANPLDPAEQANGRFEGVTFAGYTQRTHLALKGAAAAQPVPAGLWNLIQLPVGGEMLVATYHATQPRTWFGSIPPDRLRIESHCLRWRTDLVGEHKMAVRASALTGRVGYRWTSGQQCSLVIRNFLVNPAGQYVDAPFDAPNDMGYGVQMVNVDSGLGQFCELEYHAPAIGTDTDRTEGEDISQVWAYRGQDNIINDIAEQLLGIGQ